MLYWPDLFCFLFGLLTAEGNSAWLGRPLPVPFRSRQLSESLPFPMPSRLLDRDKDSGEPWERKQKKTIQTFNKEFWVTTLHLNIWYKNIYLPLDHTTQYSKTNTIFYNIHKTDSKCQQGWTHLSKTTRMANTEALCVWPRRWCSCWACMEHDWLSAAPWWSQLAWTLRSPDRSKCW